MAQNTRTGDLTSGPMLQKIILFSLPLAASSILQLLFNAADVVVVGRFAGSTALAAVGSNGALINLLVNLFVGLSLGANVVAARCFGAKDDEGVRNTVQTSVTLGLVSGFLLAVVGFFAARVLLELMSCPEDVISLSTLYLKIYFIGMPMTMLYNFSSALLRAVGNSITLEPILKADLKDYAASDGGNTQAEADHPSLSMQVQGICPYGWHIANMSDWKDLIYAVAESSKSYSDYPVAAATASYGAMTSGNAANVAAHLRCKEWQDAEFNPATVISNGAEAFAFNLYPQGWRLYKSGYDYCANSGNVRFYCLIPMMGQTTASKMALWRAYCTTSADMVFDDGFDVGNGSGAAVRCVKNYENF